jgi:membrane fusion protein, copper/silver efflux system
LSSHFIAAVQLFGIQKQVYRQFCPMANNDKGAFWLSLDEKINNPYYGSSMLTCGEVKEIIN